MNIDYYLPERILDNEEIVGNSRNWTTEKIFAKTGIRCRHIASDGESALDLAECAARKVNLDGVDFLLLCTQSSEYQLPSSACLLQERLSLPQNIGAVAFDHGCSGFVYGLSLAKGLLVSGSASRVLLVTAETYSKYIASDDTSTRTIFGDGAAAIILDRNDVGRIGEFIFGTDGSGADKLIVRDRHLYMNGPDIFNFTLDVVGPAINEICAKNGLSYSDVDLFVFHQANKFMLDAIRKVNGIPSEKFYVNLESTGNTVSSTIPIALKQLAESGRLQGGMRVMVIGFGVGLSWAGTVLRI